MTSNFLAYDESYKDGVSLATGWVAGVEGGAKSIITGQLGGEGTVRVWSTGSRLDGFPAMYLESPNHHDVDIKFSQIASFEPFGAPTGVTVATTSTTTVLTYWSAAAGQRRRGSEVRAGQAESDTRTTLAPNGDSDTAAAAPGRPAQRHLAGR